MDQRQKTELIHGLEACQVNFRYSTDKHGEVSQAEFSLWESQLEDRTATEIRQGFEIHIKNCSFFPTVSDIRNAHTKIPSRRWVDQDQKAIAYEPQHNGGMPEDARKRLHKLIDEALKDPKIKRSIEKKDSVFKKKGSVNKPPNRVIVDTGERMTQEEMNEIYYRNTA